MRNTDLNRAVQSSRVGTVVLQKHFERGLPNPLIRGDLAIARPRSSRFPFPFPEFEGAYIGTMSTFQMEKLSEFDLIKYIPNISKLCSIMLDFSPDVE